MSKKTAVVLAGGGARGAFHVGVLKQLHEQNVKIDTYYGSSIGAVNAAVLAYSDVPTLEQMWRSITKKKQIMKKRLRTYFSLGIKGTGLYSMHPLKKLITPIIDGVPNAVAAIVYTDLRTGESIYVNQDDPDFLNSVIKSASIPFIFGRYKGGVDGGVREVTPLSKAIKDGHTDIIVVLTRKPDVVYSGGLGNIYTDSLKSLYICMDEILLNDLKVCLKLNTHPDYKKINLTIYKPESPLYGSLQISKKSITYGIDMGYKSAPTSTL